MKGLALISAILVTWSLGDLWNRLTRDTSSYAATRRGVAQFGKGQYGPSSEAFKKAQSVTPAPSHAFNLGTAEIAAGEREQGSAALGEAMKDPALRADALYNRGTSALAAKAYDNAIRDFSEALRLRPADRAAKRNLEIALRRKDESQRDQSRHQQGGQGKNSKPEPKPQAGAKDQNPPQPKGDPNTEALLRSVQQQEQEELAHMHHAKPEKGRVGW